MKLYDPIKARLSLVGDDEMGQDKCKLAILQIIRENDGISEDDLLRELNRRFGDWMGEGEN